MKESVYEILTTVLSIVLVFTGVVLFQSSVNTIAVTSNSTSGTQNIEQTALVEDSLVVDPSLSDGEVRGEDAVSAVRFYQADADVSVRIIYQGRRMDYRGDMEFNVSDFNANPLDFYEQKFRVDVSSEGDEKVVVYQDV